MPTTHPRYAITDTGETAELLDVAARAWPEVRDRRELLIRLTRVGGERLRVELDCAEGRAERQREGLGRAAELVDADVLLGDDAWR